MDKTQTTSKQQVKAPRRRRLQGIVVKAAMQDTVTVRVERLFQHSRIKRVVRRSRKYLVHDPKGVARVGDTVVMEESRPISKNKRWRVMEITKEATQSDPDDGEEEDVNTGNE